ncbi:hypothetical protein JKA73_10470 [Myxococcus xanthus]|uniref:hypothetical protein n=1 Tax=Myxococcus xanthus TaxID=34 RepID=UPI001917852B|nr:hypothetical protein [Myxococcus xanthus]QQR46459.1 hypothetical protein JKA73_10470 [Myxococcus xanthus]
MARHQSTDYATHSAHVADAYTRSRAAGFVPSVTVRAMERMTVNAGWDPQSPVRPGQQLVSTKHRASNATRGAVPTFSAASGKPCGVRANG